MVPALLIICSTTLLPPGLHPPMDRPLYFQQPLPRLYLYQQQDPPPPSWSHTVTDSAGILYTPRPGDFRPRFESDAANREKQGWEEYWRWITAFYGGNLIARGWIEECDRLLAGLDTAPSRDELVRRMNILGRLAAAEWAKDNGVRRISSRDIFAWRDQLRAAVTGRHAGGDRATILLVTLRDIEAEVIDRLSENSPTGNNPSGTA